MTFYVLSLTNHIKYIYKRTTYSQFYKKVILISSVLNQDDNHTDGLS